MKQVVMQMKKCKDEGEKKNWAVEVVSTRYITSIWCRLVQRWMITEEEIKPGAPRPIHDPNACESSHMN